MVLNQGLLHNVLPPNDDVSFPSSDPSSEDSGPWNGPFRLLDLPLELEREILHHAVETNQTFFPHPIFWHGVRGYELLYVNRHVSKETLIILCGDNLFKLRPPFATSTFLQKIGAVNTSRIRSIYLNIRCERVLQYGIDWISALRLLRENYQYLRRMTVNLVGWPIVFEDWSIPFHRLRLSADTPFHRLRLSADTHFEMSTRRAILRELGQFRGIGCVTITRAPVSTSTAAHVELLESMMTTPR